MNSSTGFFQSNGLDRDDTAKACNRAKTTRMGTSNADYVIYSQSSVRTFCIVNFENGDSAFSFDAGAPGFWSCKTAGLSEP